jgi:SHS family sialic acid transporter-like MFS transporter
LFTLIGVLLGLAVIFGFLKETKGVSLLQVH